MLVIQSKKLTITKISKTEIKITADYDYDEYIAIQKFKKLILLPDEHKQIQQAKAILLIS